MPLDKRHLYRLPWSLNDNPIAWLEVTDVCNLHCEGCYRQRLTGHKPLEQVKDEILFLKRWRNPDNLSIAGGEPLVHPDIADIVAFAAENRLKPIILTNAMCLDRVFLHELTRAGLAGFTIHIDSHQSRPHWQGKSESELNELRQHYADLAAGERGLCMIFNSTVYPSTLHEVPHVVRWGRAHIDRVHGLVFITYRTATTDIHVARDLAHREVDFGRLSYITEHFADPFVTASDLCATIEQASPEYAPCAYLGGTLLHDSYKWVTAACIGSTKRMYGSLGRRSMELAQVAHHWLTGTYLAYLSSARLGARLLLLAPFDPPVRQACRHWLGDLLRHPARILEPLYAQTIAIIQAPDLQPDGRVDMCDSCPDMTVQDGRLVNSCRLDEYRLFGGPITVVERPQSVTPSEAGARRPGEAGPAEHHPHVPGP